MSPKIKYGLILGGVGLVLTICVSAAVGLCGPVVPLIAGGVAGYLAGREEPSTSQGQSAQIGAISGAIAGVGTTIGQLIGGVAALVYLQQTGTRLPIGQLPEVGNTTQQLAYYGGGLGAGLCFGLVGLALAAGAGAALAYFTFKPQTPAAPQM
jgi:hypothetical protein